MVNLYPMKSNTRDKYIVELIFKCLEDKNIFDVILMWENNKHTRQVKLHKMVLVAKTPIFENPFVQNSISEPIVFINVSPAQISLILKYMYTGLITIRIENSKQLLKTSETLMDHTFDNEMELYSETRPAFGTWENNHCIPFKSESLCSQNTTGNDDSDHNHTTDSNTTELDLNNNNVDTQQETSNAIYRNDDFETTDQPPIIGSDGQNIRFCAPYLCASITNNKLEQTEPIDLTCVKKNKSNTAKKLCHQAKAKNYFEPNFKISLPLPSNISEASLLILKSVYDIKHRRRPDCDRIFHEDPVDSRLYACMVCGKRVRSKWHHFQTHYSRDHKCSDCDAVYSRIDTLRTHAKKRHRTVIPRYYHGIPANVWHRVIVQFRPDPENPKPPSTPRPPDH